MAYDATRATRDLDAVFIRPTGPAIGGSGSGTPGTHRELAERRGERIPARPDPDAQRFYSSDSLIVDVASPRYLLAMKLFAARAEIDADGIILLCRNLGLTMVDEGLDRSCAAPSKGASVAYRVTQPEAGRIGERHRNQVSSEGVLEVPVSAPT